MVFREEWMGHQPLTPKYWYNNKARVFVPGMVYSKLNKNLALALVNFNPLGTVSTF